MLSLLLVCAAPVIASYFTYYVIRPEARSVFGELIDPQRPTPAIPAQDLQGRDLSLSSLKGQWLLISVSGGACDEVCQSNLFLQRQIRETLGRDKDRVDWLWLVDDEAPIADKLLPAVKQGTALRVKAKELREWLEPIAQHQLSDHLYVVDPMGNWMMRFPANMDAQGAAKAKRDLTRLLRASSSWDNAGRPGQL